MILKQILVTLSIASLIGCGGQGDYEPSNDHGGGNVGFGGAQDIGQFRDILQTGGIPATSTLDANGFFSEHFTELPAADCGQPLCLHGMVSVNRSWLDGNYQAVLRVALNTPLSPGDLEEKPLDLVVVVDTSGSMVTGNRLAYVKQGLGLLIDGLGPNDRLGIVQYSTDAALVAGFGEATREEMHALVEGFVAEGGTNIYDGMSLAMNVLSEQLSPERESRVVLLSDGLITVGREGAEVISLAEAHVSEGIGLTTIGVGDNFNVELMRGLAERGAGNFYYVEDPSAVTEVFTEELAYFVHPIALDLEVAVQSDPSHRIGEVYGTRNWESFGNEGGHMSIPGVFLASRAGDEPGETGRRGGGSSLYITMDRLTGAFEGEAMATVDVSYRLPGSDEVVEQSIVVDNPFREEVPEAGYVSHQEMLKAYAVYNVFIGLAKATSEAEESHDCALRTVQNLAVETSQWVAHSPSDDLTHDLALVALFADNLEFLGADAQWCGSNERPYGDDYYYDERGCSAGGGATGGGVGAALLLLLLGLGRRRYGAL